MSQNNRLGLYPECFGPPAWHFLHSVAAGYPEYTSDNNIKNQYANFFESLQFILPCESCRNHYVKNLQELPIDPYLGGRKDLSMWVYKLHNLVNKITHKDPKKIPTFEEVYKKYNSYGIPCDSNTNTCGGHHEKHCNIEIYDSLNKHMYYNTYNGYWGFMFFIVILIIVIIVMAVQLSQKKKRR